MKLSTAAIDLHYLPCIEYFACLHKFDSIIIDIHEHFIKQTFRNRCYILGANNIQPLSVPVIGGNKKIPVKEIRIDHSQRWSDIHWRSIQSAYGKAPFYEFFADHFSAIFEKREKFLFDLNSQLLTLCLELLSYKPQITYSETYMKEYRNDNILDLRSLINPKALFSERNFYIPYMYRQVFGKNFAPNLSIVDLLLCEGPNAGNIVTKSMQKE